MTASQAPLYAALWLPRFQLQAVLRVRPAPRGAAVAVLDCDELSCGTDLENKGRILHANDLAQRHLVETGMTPSQALARCARLMVLHRDPVAEAGAQEELLQCAAGWTPDYESTRPGWCVLDLSRAREVHARKAACGEEMRSQLQAAGLEARVGFAAHPDLACLAARGTQPVWVMEDSEEDGWRKQLPVEVLEMPAAILEVLKLWGVRTLAQFAALPRADIAERLGTEGALLWDISTGGRNRLLRLLRTPADFSEEFAFEHPVEMLEPLLFMLGRMLGNLCGLLAEVWLLAADMRLELCFEDQSAYAQTLHVAEPTRDVALLLRVLHTYLEGRSAAAPIIAVSLALTPARPAAQQTHLFERRLRDPNRFSETLARLEALLGRGNVGRVQLLPSRRPDAFVVTNYLETHADPSAAREAGPGIPLRSYRPPRRVFVTLCEGSPVALDLSGAALAIQEARGPWLLSGDWWDQQAWRREVWEICTTDGALYQLAHEKDGWVLDGIFG